MGKNQNKGTEVSSGDRQIDLVDLPALSDEALKQLAVDNGIELWDGYDREGLIKAITELVEGEGSDSDTDPEKADSGGVEIVSTIRAGKTIIAVTGKPITFDKDGKATVHPRDAEYLNTCPGFGN
jgi:hypothetical protein